MPLEVSAVLDREAAIYLTGEVIGVKGEIGAYLSDTDSVEYVWNLYLTSFNMPSPMTIVAGALFNLKRRKGTAISWVTLKNLANKGRESLAWGSVQLTCERTLGAQITFRDRPTTSISRSASTVFSSKPNVLFCDVELLHGESRQFTCKIPLPMHELPPSFRGYLVRYLNRITVAVQHVRAPIKLMHIPVRVIPAVGIDEAPKIENNPFLTGSMAPATISQTMMATIDEITAPKRAYMFSMTNTKGKVATMTLFKKTFRLGEDVLGMLSFEDSDVPCVQYSVHLETVEELAEDVVGEHGEVKSEGMMNVAVYSNDYVVCAFASESSFRLSIPMHAPPTFHTDTVHLKWRLRFEFVTSEPLINVVYGEVCKAPVDVPIETLAWRTDIYVLPCSPQNAALTDSSHVGNASMVL